MPTRPPIPNGYLGSQPKFADLGLGLMSHTSFEIDIDTNSLEVKLQFNPSKKVKVTHQLINCATEKEESEYVFTQTQGNVITFIISLQCAEYYKFQIFALASDDDNKTLPNVLNYLINCKKALHPCFPYPKQYAQWKDGCNISSPLFLHRDMPLNNVNFCVHVPGANNMAVIADSTWMHLKQNGDNFEGCLDLSAYKGKKVTLNANMVADETKYSTMLEYNI